MSTPPPNERPLRPPVILIGLDGAEPSLMQQWMDDGTLPTLARMRRDGICTDVATMPGFGDGAVWPTLVTGVNPARHGRYFRQQFKPCSYRRKLFSVDSDLSHQPFWTTLSQRGRRVAILDLPYARLESNLNGLLLVDWLIHDRYGSPRSWPASFANDVLEEFGDDPLLGNADLFSKHGTMNDVIERLHERVGMKERLLTRTLGGAPWDFVATTFTEPHDLGHVGWHLRDPLHPRHDAAWLQRFGDPIRALYMAIDLAIGRILATAPDGAHVLMFAGLGMGPNYTANGAMEEMLERMDGKGYRQRAQLSKRLRSSGWPETIASFGGKVDTLRDILACSRSRFFKMPHNENSGAIRINLKGREPSGRVAPEQFDAICDELTTKFMALRNPATGLPIVERVVRVAQNMCGPHLHSMPDLLVVWNREAPFDSIESAEIGRISGVRSWGRSGDHSARAMLIAQGEAFNPAHLYRSPHIVDIAATVAALLDVEMPDIDGRAICGLSAR